tara:strand:- start:134 stop:382 length:249 start_codon:yes stop_codon:yes gene_type:complete
MNGKQKMMDEKYELRFAKIEEWAIANPDMAISNAMIALIEAARASPEDAASAYDAIRMMARGLEDWPICRCGKIHKYGDEEE